MEKVLAVLGGVFVVFVLVLFSVATIDALKKRRGSTDSTKSIGQLYFKDFPDGTRTWRIALDKDLDTLKEGESYILTVMEEKLIEREKELINQIKEE